MEINDIQRVKDAAAVIANDVRALAQKHGAGPAAERLAAVIDQLAKGNLNVVVCGEFKQGKTTLLNALLCAPGLLPTDTDIATTAVTRIAYGETERITAHIEDNGKASTEDVPRARLGTYITAINNAGGNKRVRLVNVELPSPLLAGGMVLIDTPGIGSIAIEHSEMTYGFLPMADLVLFVTATVMSEYDIAFLKNRVAPFRRHVVVALTRIDDAEPDRPWTTISDSNRAKLDATFRDNSTYAADPMRIMPVSSMRFLDSLKTNDPKIAAESRLPALAAAIQEHVGTHGARLLALRAIEESQRALDELRAPIETTLAMMKATSEEEIKAIQSRLDETSGRLKELGEFGAWREDLIRGFSHIREVLSAAQREESIALRAQLTAKLANSKQLENPPAMGRDTAADLQTHRAMLNQTALELVTALREKVANSARIALPGTGGMQDNAAALAAAPNLANARKRQPLVRRVFTTGRLATVSTATGGTMGSFFGAAIGGAIGFIFGGIGAVPGAALGSAIGGSLGASVGGYQGVREGLETVAQREDTDTRIDTGNILYPFLDTEMGRIWAGQKDTLTAAEVATNAEFKGEIETAKRINQTELAAFTSQRSAKHADAAGRMQEWNRKMQEITNLQDRIDREAGRFAARDETADAPQEEAGASHRKDIGIDG